MALWRGWLPSVIGVVPYVGLNFGVYETAKDVIIKMYGAYPQTYRRRTACVPQAYCMALTVPLCGSTVPRGASRCVELCRGAQKARFPSSPLWPACLLLSVLPALLRLLHCCPAAGLRDERDLSIAVRLGCGALAGTMGQVRRRQQAGRGGVVPAVC